MTNYNELSRQDINYLVASIKFAECIELEIFNNIDGSVDVVSQGQSIEIAFDPCNNPQHWTELMAKNKICLEWTSEEVGEIQAIATPNVDTENYEDFMVYDDCAGVAVGKCFLMMNEKEGVL